jgi:cytochrome-b5 reductase
MAQHVSSFSSSTSPSPSARWGYYIPLSLVLLFPATYFLTRSASSPHLSPQVYSDHAIASSHNLIPSHKEITIPVPASQRDLFDQSAVRRDGTPLEKGEVAVQHVMIKNPDLQIERPYTPVNDVAGDGEMGLVVKRVRGGEVGRYVGFHREV